MQPPILLHRCASIAFICVLFVLVIGAVVQFSPGDGYFGWDWFRFFHPSLQSILAMKTPYNGTVFNPPWALLVLLPLALLPVKVGAAVLAVTNLAAIVYTAKRLGAGLLSIFTILLTPTALLAVCAANIDGIVMLGAILPPQIGLFFVLAKPQMGIGITLYWLYEAYKRGGVRECVRVFSPVMIAIVLSLTIFGLYPMQYRDTTSLGWNYALWPYSIPAGILLLVFAMWKRRITFAGTSGLCLTPYLNFQSYLMALFTMLPYRTWTLAICIAQWVIFAVIVIARPAI